MSIYLKTGRVKSEWTDYNGHLNMAYYVLMFDNATDPVLLALVLVLMLLNWGLEATKWKFLLRKIEIITFTKAMKSIFAGACVSIFTPNRLGEFGGRIFYLKPSNRVYGVMITFIYTTGMNQEVWGVFFLIIWTMI